MQVTRAATAGTVADGSITTAKLADGAVTAQKSNAQMREGGWLPSGGVSQTVLDRFVGTNVMTTASGTLTLAGGAILPKGVAVSNVSFFSGNVAVSSATSQFFVIVDSALNLLAITADDGATAWAINSIKTLPIAQNAAGGAIASYTPSADTEAYLGIVEVATTPANLRCAMSNAALLGLSPPLAATSNTGLTDRASLVTAVGSNGGKVAALTNIANCAWAYCGS